MKLLLILQVIFVHFIFLSCSNRHTEKIEIDYNNTVYFNSEIWGFGGGHTKFTITDTQYFHKDCRTIDFGDIGETPILYELKKGKLIIHTYLKNIDKDIMPDLIGFTFYNNGIQYVAKLDSVNKGLTKELKIYFPMDFYLRSDNKK